MQTMPVGISPESSLKPEGAFPAQHAERRGIGDKLNTEINAALADPKMKARLAEWGATALVRAGASPPASTEEAQGAVTNGWLISQCGRRAVRRGVLRICRQQSAPELPAR